MKSNNLRFASLLGLLAAVPLAGQSTLALFHPGQIRVLILSGRNNHDWRTTTPALKKVLIDTGRFDVRVEEEPAGITAGTLAAYQVIVSDYNGPRLGAATEKAVADFVHSGKGLVVVHAADYAFGDLPVLGDHHVSTSIVEAPWKEWFEMTGGAWVRGTSHAPRGYFNVVFADRNHPVARDLPAEFETNDELYHKLKLSPEIHVVATAFDDASRGGVGKDIPVMWTVKYGSGRTFHTTLGHDVSAIQIPGFEQSFARGVEWAATGGVAPAVIRETKPPLRVLVVTGGHSHAPSFYTMFDQREGIRTVVEPHPTAFRNDFRRSTDVLVLYDLSEEIGEPQRQHLREFVESGKGLVVLHHAIADYNSWEWWWKEVVGAKYFLHDEPGHPRTKWKEGIDLRIRPSGKHPVLEGVSTMLFDDEAYKGKWISDTSTPILTCDSPYSDKVVGWISAYSKSRVVVITPGHGPGSHRDPMYRKLVYNAMLWAGGRK